MIEIIMKPKSTLVRINELNIDICNSGGCDLCFRRNLRYVDHSFTTSYLHDTCNYASS